MSSSPFALATKARRPSSSRREAEQLLDELSTRGIIVSIADGKVWLTPASLVTIDIHNRMNRLAYLVKPIILGRARRRALGLPS